MSTHSVDAPKCLPQERDSARKSPDEVTHALARAAEHLGDGLDSFFYLLWIS